MPSLTVVDWIAIALIVVSALGGWRRGLIASALALLGLVAGAYAGSKVAPHLLRGGAKSQWAAVASLIGAIFGATFLQALAVFAGSFVRGGLRLTPFRFLDSAAGFLFGAVTGVAFVWVLGATALLLPGQTRLRQEVQRSTLVRRLDEALPPRRALNLLARIDPFPSIAGPAAPNLPPSPSVGRDPTIRDASRAVVRVVGTACGIGIEGTGWFARDHLVVTAAHVVAGEDDTRVQIPDVDGLHAASVVAFDAHNDVAVLRVPDVRVDPLELAAPNDGAAVGIVGYPENGPLTTTPGRVGRTSTVLTQDAYGRGPVSRKITAIAGTVEHGNSGGPAIDKAGKVEATVFAARLSGSGGFGIPSDVVAGVLSSAGQRPVSTGECAAG
ncbi:MAG TPA: MarP family serine protease [Gaiellaceae bacterium]